MGIAFHGFKIRKKRSRCRVIPFRKTNHCYLILNSFFIARDNHCKMQPKNSVKALIIHSIISKIIKKIKSIIEAVINQELTHINYSKIAIFANDFFINYILKSFIRNNLLMKITGCIRLNFSRRLKPNKKSFY